MEKSDLVILLQDVRFSYFYGFTPFTGRNDQGQETKNYCCHFLMPPTHPQLPQIKALMRQAANNAWREQGEAVLQQLAAQDRLCLHNGNITKAGQEAYKDMFYISANSKVRPTIVETRNGVNVPLVEADGRPYSGCYGNAIVSIWPQTGGGKQSFGKRINAQWQGAQFLRHGEAFGGGRVARPDEFGLVASEADGAAPAAAAGNDATGLI